MEADKGSDSHMITGGADYIRLQHNNYEPIEPNFMKAFMCSKVTVC